MTFFAAFAAWECTFVVCTLAVAWMIEEVALGVREMRQRRALRPAPLPTARLL